MGMVSKTVCNHKVCYTSCCKIRSASACIYTCKQPKLFPFQPFPLYMTLFQHPDSELRFTLTLVLQSETSSGAEVRSVWGRGGSINSLVSPLRLPSQSPGWNTKRQRDTLTDNTHVPLHLIKSGRTQGAHCREHLERNDISPCGVN